MKRKIGRIIAIILVVVTSAMLLGGCGEERKKLKEEYKVETERIQKEEEMLAEKLDECQALIDSGEKPYEKEKLTTFIEAVATAPEKVIEIPKRPFKTEDIKILVNDTLKKTSYLSTIEKLNTLKEELERSIKIMKQITNPSEEFVIKCVMQADTVVDYEAATEDHDPNGNLHKPGGYTSAVYFKTSTSRINPLISSSIVSQGTEAGGQIEVYETAADAYKRDEYLAGFDGSILVSGSHRVLGTMVIRTSQWLTATQQKELEEQLVTIFTTLPEE